MFVFPVLDWNYQQWSLMRGNIVRTGLMSFAFEKIPRIRLSCKLIRLCHTAAILSRETKKALFYHAELRSQNRGGEAKRGKRKLFWSPGTIWPPCDKGEF